jgi:hypothetical protein
VFTACAERGSSVTLKSTEKTEIKHIEKKDAAIPTLVLRKSSEDTVQKNISGSLILIIGLILFL